MKRHSTRRLSRSLAGVIALIILAGGCGGSSADDAAAPDRTAKEASATRLAPTDPPETDPGPTDPPQADTTPADDTSVETTSSTVVDDSWAEEIGSVCASAFGQMNAIVENNGTPDDMSREIAEIRGVYEGDFFATVATPAQLQPTLENVRGMGDEALDLLAEADERVAAGDLVAAQSALQGAIDRAVRVHSVWPMAGVPCALGDPARVESADLTVLLEMNPWQLTSGFGSIWVSEQWGDTVVRLDPESGKVLARVEVSAGPVKAQPADGRLWVRTAATYDAIDPSTDTVVASIAKADVGQAANYSWAVDGALWICDGQRLHRYDPADLSPVATIELAFDCGAVFATEELAVAWNLNYEPGESGSTVAVFVDPASNSVLATTALPVDVQGPAVFDNAVYFPGFMGETAVVVDRATWSVSVTPDMGATGAGTGQPAWDDRAIYVVADGFSQTGTIGTVVVIDPSTWAPMGTIEPLEVNAVTVLDGAVWTASESPFDVVQRYDLG